MKYDDASFMAEFEELKKKYGNAFTDVRAVRFAKNGDLDRAFVPYWCRADDDGFITCEDERPV